MNFSNLMLAQHSSCSLAPGTPEERAGVMGLQRDRRLPQLVANFLNSHNEFTVTIDGDAS
jgi:hypothetical protein